MRAEVRLYRSPRPRRLHLSPRPSWPHRPPSFPRPPSHA